MSFNESSYSRLNRVCTSPVVSLLHRKTQQKTNVLLKSEKYNCQNDYYNGIIPNNSNFYKWIIDKHPCDPPCQSSKANINSLDAVTCKSCEYQNGICDVGT